MEAELARKQRAEIIALLKAILLAVSKPGTATVSLTADDLHALTTSRRK